MGLLSSPRSDSLSLAGRLRPISKRIAQNVKRLPPNRFRCADDPAKWTGKVIGVADNDTINVLTDQNRVIRVRFNGIDTRERGQPFANNAKQFVSDAVFGKPVTKVDHGADRYDRTLGDFIHNEKNLNLDIVTAGLAWHYKKYSGDEQLAAANRRARAIGKGLWSDPRQVAPWDLRKLSKIKRDELR